MKFKLDNVQQFTALFSTQLVITPLTPPNSKAFKVTCAACALPDHVLSVLRVVEDDLYDAVAGRRLLGRKGEEPAVGDAVEEEVGGASTGDPAHLPRRVRRHAAPAQGDAQPGLIGVEVGVEHARGSPRGRGPSPPLALVRRGQTAGRGGEGTGRDREGEGEGEGEGEDGTGTGKEQVSVATVTVYGGRRNVDSKLESAGIQLAAAQ